MREKIENDLSLKLIIVEADCLKRLSCFLNQQCRSEKLTKSALENKLSIFSTSQLTYWLFSKVAMTG